MRSPLSINTFIHKHIFNQYSVIVQQIVITVPNILQEIIPVLSIYSIRKCSIDPITDYRNICLRILSHHSHHSFFENTHLPPPIAIGAFDIDPKNVFSLFISLQYFIVASSLISSNAVPGALARYSIQINCPRYYPNNYTFPCSYCTSSLLNIMLYIYILHKII